MIKLNWKYLIILIYVSFILFITWLIYKSINQEIHLVSKNYYQDELSYSEIIEAKQNTINFKNDIIIDKNNENLLNIDLPPYFDKNQNIGYVYFYCPSNENNDYKIVFNTDLSGQQQIDISELKPSYYVIKLSWESKDKKYYFEQNLTKK